MFRIDAPAKLNLFFEVLGLRSDRYHDISTLTVPISIFDHLTFCPLGTSSKDVHLEIRDGKSGLPLNHIPNDERNLVVKAVREFFKLTGFSRGLSIFLEKNIPSEAGLGGGSSDAAATLSALNLLWETKLVKKDLQEIGSRIGSDVPLFFETGFSVGTGRGEITEPVTGLPPLCFLVFKPLFGLSTPKVYAAIPEVPPAERRSPEELIAAIREKDTIRIQRHFFNRLEGAARRLSPEFDAVFTQLLKVAPFTLTGSGTALYSLVSTPDESEFLSDQVKKMNIPGEIFFVKTLCDD